MSDETWIAMSERKPGANEREIWTWNGKSVGTLSSATRITAAELKEFWPDVTHWMPKLPPKPPLPPKEPK